MGRYQAWHTLKKSDFQAEVGRWSKEVVAAQAFVPFTTLPPVAHIASPCELRGMCISGDSLYYNILL
jgi:hypothetical protein